MRQPCSDRPISDDGRPYVDAICNRCSRQLRPAIEMMDEALAGERIGAVSICDVCYDEMLVPGPGDAHGNMS
ncbi:MAG: hypothetical protein QNJ22_18570 [Desulfosarcinaceae bacterium]|nr:hypothetical protein [Desulfosarcinaceae bacterium]